MPRTIRTLDDLTRPEVEALEARTEFKSRWMLLNIIGSAYVMATVVMGVVTALGVIPRPEDAGEGQMIWPALAILAFLEIPMMGFLGGKLLKQAASKRAYAAVAAQAFTAMVVCMAFAVSIAIYGMIGNALAMPKAVQLGLVALGLVALVGGQVWVRGRARPLMLIALARERAKDGDESGAARERD